MFEQRLKFAASPRHPRIVRFRVGRQRPLSTEGMEKRAIRGVAGSLDGPIGRQAMVMSRGRYAADRRDQALMASISGPTPKILIIRLML